jgi:hypothetical protein
MNGAKSWFPRLIEVRFTSSSPAQLKTQLNAGPKSGEKREKMFFRGSIEIREIAGSPFSGAT